MDPLELIYIYMIYMIYIYMYDIYDFLYVYDIYDFLETAKLFALAGSSPSCRQDAEDAGLFETSHRHNYKPLDSMNWEEAKFCKTSSEHF